MVSNCATGDLDRRKVFWTTQPDSFEVQQLCGAQCANPGLNLVPVGDLGTTIATSDWVRGLILNMLLTYGRAADRSCGYRPGSIGGHWSESFAQPPTRVGDLVYTIETSHRMSDLVKLANEYVRTTLQKLIAYGVASKVTLETTYQGDGVVAVEVQVYGSDGKSERVGLSGSVVQNYWVWQ